MKARFEKGSGCYTCRICGGLTRDTGHDEGALELCAACLYEEEIVNKMSDNDMTREEAIEDLKPFWK